MPPHDFDNNMDRNWSPIILARKEEDNAQEEIVVVETEIIEDNVEVESDMRGKERE